MPSTRQRHEGAVTARRLRACLGGTPFSRRDALAAGASARQLRTAVAAGHLVRLRAGLYRVAPEVDGQVAAPLDDGGVVLRTRSWREDDVRLVMTGLSPKASVAHAAAGAILGVATPWGMETKELDIIVPGQAERRDGGVRVHQSRLPAHHVIEVRGIRVTTPARTAVDLARGQPPERALIPLDSAARLLVAADAGLWTPGSTTEVTARAARAWREAVRDPASVAAARATLREAYGQVFGWPGTRVVREVLDLVDPASESAFESWSRGVMLQAGLPSPQVGAPVRGGSGTEYWADFLWTGRRILGEADGWGKYGGTVTDVRERISRERRRQQDLEAAGWRVLRWDPREHRRAWLLRIHAALAGPRVTAEMVG